MIVRFLTKRFIGDYEPNTGEWGGHGGDGRAGMDRRVPVRRLTALPSPGNLYSRLVRLDGDHVAVQIQDTPGCIQVRRCFGSIHSSLLPKAQISCPGFVS